MSTSPARQSEPSYAQLYIIDSDEANHHRATTFPELDKCVLNPLSIMLRDISPFPRMLKSMQDIVDEYLTKSSRVMPSFHLGFVSGKTPEPHRYNKPSSAGEIACVFVAKDGAPPHNRDIVIYPHGEPVIRPPANNDQIMPLTYPLLFPYGDRGWQPDLQHAPEYQSAVYTRVSPVQFLAHRLMVRSLENPLPHSAGATFHQSRLMRHFTLDHTSLPT